MPSSCGCGAEDERGYVIHLSSAGRREDPININTHYSYEEIIWTTSGKMVPNDTDFSYASGSQIK